MWWINIRKHKEHVSSNRGVFLTINSDNSGSTVQRPAGEPPQTYESSLVPPWHRRTVLPGSASPLSPRLLPVPTATTNPIPAESEGRAEILLLAPTSHEVRAVRNWEALSLFASACTNGISWAAVRRKREGAPHNTYFEWRQPAKQPTLKCWLLHLQTTHICR